MALVFFGVGFLAQTMQVVLFREIFLTLNGSELAFGFVLAIWLLWGALGATLGSFIKRAHRVLHFSLLLFVGFLPVTLSMLRIMRLFVGLEAGQLPPLAPTLLLSALICGPIIFLCGFLFSVGLAINAAGPAMPPARCYGLDALGDVAAGALSAALLAAGLNHLLLSAIACALITTAALSISHTPLPRPLLPGLLLLLAVSSPFFEEATQHLRWSTINPEFRLLQTENSPYGETAVLTMDGHQRDIFRNGRYAFSLTPEGESYEAAKAAHPLLCAHPSPKNILLAGESPDMLPEILRHPIEHLDCLWLDPALNRVLQKQPSKPLQYALRDRRLAIHLRDPRAFLAASNTRWDIIAVTGGLPSTLASNRLFTTQFARIAKEHLTDGGLLAYQVHTVPSLQETQLRRVAVLAKTLKTVFAHVRPTVGGWLFASDGEIDLRPETLERRYRQRGVHSDYFVPELFTTLLLETDQKRLERYIAPFIKDAAPNTDTDPSLVRDELLFLGRLTSPADMALVEAAVGLKVWYLLLCAGALCGLVLLKRGRIYGAVGTAGFAGLAAGLVVLHTFQATVGATYLLLGVLTALFMLGLSAGSHVSGKKRRWERFAGAGLAPVALGAYLLGPISGALLFCLNFAAGFCVGAVYGRATSLLGDARSAGILFGSDLAGATAAAVLVGCALIITSGIPAVVVVTTAFAAVATILMK